MAMTLSQYRSPTVFPNQTEYNNAMEQAYQSGLAAKSSYQHGMKSGDENARLQTLYAKQKELEQRKSEIDSRIKEIQVHLEQTKDYMNDPLYRTARSKYIWEGDDTNLVNYRKMQADLAKTKATEELNKQMRERGEEASKITLRNRANAAQEILDKYSEDNPDYEDRIRAAKHELNESIEQLANMGEIYEPKTTQQTTEPKSADKGEPIDDIVAEWKPYKDGKYKLDAETKKKFEARINDYLSKATSAGDIRKKAKDLLVDIQATKVYVPPTFKVDELLQKSKDNGEPFGRNTKEAKFLKENGYIWDAESGMYRK